jgi:rhodanese-related sulfurtransferase
VVSPPDDGGLDTGVTGSGKCAGLGLIGDNDPNVRSNVRAIDQSLEVCTRAGCEYCDVDLALRDADAARSVERGGIVSVGWSLLPWCASPMNYQNVPAADWAQWAEDNGAMILDVREPKEWALGTLPDATLVSMYEIPTRLGEFPRDQAILCVCRSGDRSGQVAAFLTQNGYESVANMTGGMKALGMQG